MQFTSFDSQQLILPCESRRPSLSMEGEVTLREEDPAESYKIGEVLSKYVFFALTCPFNLTKNS